MKKNEENAAKDGEETKENILQKMALGYSSLLHKIHKGPIKVMIPKGTGEVNESIGRGSKYTVIPPITEKGVKEVEFFPINEPFTYVRILYNTNTNEYLYEAIEPQISSKEMELLNIVKDTLSRTLSYNPEEMGKKDIKEYLLESLNSFLRSRDIHLDPITEEKLKYYLIRDFVGYGPVDILMNDPQIEDISCDGVGIPIFVFHQKYESIKTTIKFDDENELDSYVIGLGQRCGKQVSVSNPILDGTTGEGHRIQATYSYEVTTRGSTFTIRRFKEKPFTFVDLIKFGTASPEMVAYIWIAVEHGESMICAGGPACGKTSTLNAAMLFCPPTAKIVSMEDTREINLYHKNWIPGVTRSGFGERGIDGKAAGEVDMYDLVRAALRQRPNYIMVGEVRGKETYTMFQAMATGHTTYSTMHAESIKAMVHRLENPPISCPRILLTALNFVIIQSLVRVKNREVRRIKQITEIIGFEPETNELITNTVYEWDQKTDRFIYKGHSFIFDKIQEMKNLTHEEMEEEFRRRVDVIRYAVEKNLTELKDIADLIVGYYKEPMAVVERIRNEMGWTAPEEEVEELASII